MSFTKFKNKNYVGKNILDGYSITYGWDDRKSSRYLKAGIYFGGGMDPLFENKKSIRTYSDKEKQLVAVEPNNDARDDFNRALRKNGNRRWMTGNSFIKLMVEELGYKPSKKLKYEVLESGLIVLHKEEVEA